MALKYTGGLGKPPGYRYGFGDPAAPAATGGRPQPVSGSPRRVTVKRHTRTLAPKAPAAPKQSSDDALIQAATRLRYGPQEAAYGQQLAQNARFSSGVGDWYQNALAEIRGLQQQGQASSQQALQGIQSYASQPTLQNPTDQRAADARNQLNAQFAAMFSSDAQANSAGLDRIQASYANQQANTSNQANAERMRLLAGQAQLKGQEGDFQTQYGAQLQTARQKSALDQIKTDLAAQALGIKVDTLKNVQEPLAQSLIGNRRSQQKVARTNARTQRQNVRVREKQNAVGNALKVNDLQLKAYKLEHPNAGKGGGSNSTYSNSKVQGFRANWDYAQATAKQLRDKKTYTDKGGNVKPVTADVAYSALLNATKDPDIAKAASLIAYGKPIPASLRHKLAIKGVHPPKSKAAPSLGQVVVKGLNNLAGG